MENLLRQIREALAEDTDESRAKADRLIQVLEGRVEHKLGKDQKHQRLVNRYAQYEEYSD